MKIILRTFLLLSLIGLFNSCQRFSSDSVDCNDPASLDDYSTKASSSKEFSDSDISYEFLASKDPKQWGNIVGLENRFDACKIPDDFLTDMNSNEMANFIVHYPLNYLIFAYNDPIDAVKLIFENSQLHKQFIKRNDAGNVIADIFSSTAVDLSIERSCYDNRLDTLSYVNEMFLDYLIASGLLSESIDSEHNAKILYASECKITERESDPVVFSSNSIFPLYLTVGRVTTTTYHTIRTFFGQSLSGITLDELSYSEIIALTNYAITNYPNAILRGSATNKYNCHSYAWHQQSLQNTTWLNGYYNGSLQLSKYWTNDLYVSCAEESAEKVFYAADDHSAIALANGNYQSKWGSLPLMEHDPADCPYMTTNMQYFKERTNPLLVSIVGNTQVIPGQTNQYYVSTPFQGAEYTWNVGYMATDDPGLSVLTDQYSPQCSLTCNDLGLFKLCVNINHVGHTVAYAQANVIARPYW